MVYIYLNDSMFVLLTPGQVLPRETPSIDDIVFRLNKSEQYRAHRGVAPVKPDTSKRSITVTASGRSCIQT